MNGDTDKHKRQVTIILDTKTAFGYIKYTTEISTNDLGQFYNQVQYFINNLYLKDLLDDERTYKYLLELCDADDDFLGIFHKPETVRSLINPFIYKVVKKGKYKYEILWE